VGLRRASHSGVEAPPPYERPRARFYQALLRSCGTLIQVTVIRTRVAITQRKVIQRNTVSNRSCDMGPPNFLDARRSYDVSCRDGKV